VPLSRIQGDVLRVLASHRDPEIYAGSTSLSRHSDNLDIFHDRAERVEEAAIEDAATLQRAGFDVTWRRQLRFSYTAEIKRADEITDLEWVADSDFRFFPTIPDDLFGYILHPVDLAANKVMAAASRSEVRDLVDIVTVHEQVLSLGAVIWAAVEKAPGFTPEGLIAEIRRNTNYPAAEWLSLATSQPVDPNDILARLRAALADAEAFVRLMPTEKKGLLFLENSSVVQPDPGRLSDYQTHAGRRRGQWPTSGEISSAMLERYRQKPRS
jgi:hypothetical protein